MISTMAFWRTKKKNHDKQAKEAANLFTEVENDPFAETYEDANSWRADSAEVFFCRSSLDNIPEEWTRNDCVFAISQSRSPGHKDNGQDCLGCGSHKDWEVRVLCDGHDRKGHMVALGVCRMMPHILLRLIHERSKDEVNDIVSDDLIRDAFEETERTVCWTQTGVTQGVFVKVFGGEWDGQVGHVAESVSNDKVIVVIVDEEGYHRSPIEKKYLRSARYTGGSTCVTLVRNKTTNMCKVGIVGDSRLVVLPSTGLSGDPILEEIVGSIDEDYEKPAPTALITPAHNVFNEREQERLQEGYRGQYEFDGNFLVNPVTKFAIQPTRGFGDFDMWGTGYTNTPEISNSFFLQPGSLLFAASDGVFDNHVWQDEEFITFLAENKEQGVNTRQLVDFVFKETISRSLDGGYVDDISMFCYIAPKSDGGSGPLQAVSEPVRRQGSKRSVGSKRATIKRNDDTAFTALSETMQKLQSQRSQRDLHRTIQSSAAEIESEYEDEELEREDEEATEKVGVLLQRFAKKYGHSFDNIEPKELVKGDSFRGGKFIQRDEDDDDDDSLATPREL